MDQYQKACLGFALLAAVNPVFAQSASEEAAAPAAEITAAPIANPDEMAPPTQAAAVPETVPESVPVTPPVEPAAKPEARAASTSRLMEEIIVTAQKRAENVQDVPISINAFSAETLDARGISDPKELQLATPGLTVGSQAGFTVTYLRGVGSDGFLLADPSIALYIDGIYFPFAHGQAQNFGAIERVEVLKGPQGTLFGRNAVGGAISVVTKAPSFEAPEVSVQASYSRFDNLQTRAHVNIPLSDTFAMSVSGLYGTEDDYRDGTAAGKPLPGEVSKGARVKLRWAPVEALDFTLAGFKLEQIGAGTMFATNSAPAPDFALLIPKQEGGEGSVDTKTFFELDNTVVYGQGVLYTDWFDVKLLASDQSIDTHSQYDFDGSATPIVSFIAHFFADVKTAEVQIISNDTSWAADRLKWIGGYYHFDGRQGLDVNFAVAGSVLDDINDILSPVLGALPVPLPRLVPGQLLNATGILQTDSDSLYAQATYDFTDWMDLTLGLRAQEEKRTIVQSGGAVAVTPGEPIPYTDFRGQTDTTRSLSPKVSLDLRPWDDGLLYLSYQKAVKSSTFNVVNFLHFTDPTPVKKEELTAYEAGIKTKLFDNTTTLSAAAFYYDIKNIQVQFISLLAGGAVTFENAPAAEVKGIDFDLTSQLFPSVIDGLVLTAGGAFVNAKFTDFHDAQGFNDLGVYSPNNDYTGKRIPRSPKFSGTVGLSQTFDIPGGPLEFGADYYYNSGFYYLAQNTDFNHENAYGILGARISYLYEAWNLRTTLFGKNITNERYNYSRFTNDFGGLDSVAPPFVYGVRLNWDF